MSYERTTEWRLCWSTRSGSHSIPAFDEADARHLLSRVDLEAAALAGQEYWVERRTVVTYGWERAGAEDLVPLLLPDGPPPR